MKTFQKNLIITILLLVIISNAKSEQLFADPIIKFDNLNYDFGTVKPGENLEHIFKFTNEGKGTLLISSVQPSCGCTGVVMDEKKEFKNGESGEIKITFNTQGREGSNSKTITVNTNDSENPVIILSFKCDVKTN